MLGPCVDILQLSENRSKVIRVAVQGGGGQTLITGLFG